VPGLRFKPRVIGVVVKLVGLAVAALATPLNPRIVKNSRPKDKINLALNPNAIFELL
jgi:hypothetical protein